MIRASKTYMGSDWDKPNARTILDSFEEMKKTREKLEAFTEEMYTDYARMRERISEKTIDDILEGEWTKYEAKFEEGKEAIMTLLHTWATSQPGSQLVRIQTLKAVTEKILDGGQLIRRREIAFTEAEKLIIPSSDLSRMDRKIWIVTTASLPWMTGTSVNPLLRAAMLAQQRGPGKVTLMLPWLNTSDQQRVFPKGRTFQNQEEQAAYVKEWLNSNTKLRAGAINLSLRFYPARYHSLFGSIFAMGDITRLIPDEESDVCILEEPEHLNWYRAEGSSWYQKFNHVIGICHTNYRSYLGEEIKVLEVLIHYINIWTVRAYCHRVIKLSGVLQKYAPEKEVVCNVHGVRDTFLEIGAQKAVTNEFSKGAYFIGKMLWGKGYDLMAKLLDYCTSEGILRSTVDISIDVYGSGPDEAEIKDFFSARSLQATFFPATDHGLLAEYKIFINPSISEVLCTTTAEALAMGKFAIIPNHPSNAFFKPFPNCLMYRTRADFRRQIKYAKANSPVPMTPELLHPLTWEAATERLIASSSITQGERRRFNEELDRWCEWSFRTAGRGYKGDIIRWLGGGENIAEQTALTKRVESEHAYQDARNIKDQNAYIKRVEESYQDQVSLIGLLKNLIEADQKVPEKPSLMKNRIKNWLLEFEGNFKGEQNKR